MTQELFDLKQSILEGRYEDVLNLVDELEGMSQQAILHNIESYLIRLIVHLLKKQIENRLTNYWVASISDSILKIKKLNLKDNKVSYYIKSDEWQPFLEEAIEAAIAPTSVEALNGQLTPMQLSERIDRNQIMMMVQILLDLTYVYSAKELPEIVNQSLAKLPGGQAWYKKGI